MSRFWVGIDVSKRKLDVALLNDAGKVKSKSLANDPAGFAALMTWLQERGADSSSTHVCMESTGTYSDGCATAFADAGWHVTARRWSRQPGSLHRWNIASCARWSSACKRSRTCISRKPTGSRQLSKR